MTKLSVPKLAENKEYETKKHIFILFDTVCRKANGKIAKEEFLIFAIELL